MEKPISFLDTKTIVKPDGTTEEVPSFIPDCCREGWKNCPHVLKKQKPMKKNIAL